MELHSELKGQQWSPGMRGQATGEEIPLCNTLTKLTLLPPRSQLLPT